MSREDEYNRQALMVRVFEGAAVLLLLSFFLAYIIAPALPPIRRLIRVGERRRPISDGAAILVLYTALLLPGLLLWRSSAPTVKHWIAVTAPESVTRMFSGEQLGPLQKVLQRAPLPAGLRTSLMRATQWAASSLEHSARETLDQVITAARYASWLTVAPIAAFLLLTAAPIFQRSALRVLPRGHVQWRAEEYLRDVNSALAGYVRAQSAAALIVGVQCVAGFLLLGLPSAVSLGVLAGILELVPAIGPLTALIIAASHTEHALAVVLFLGIVRLVQDYVIYPRLVRHGMHLSTLAVILTVWTGAALAQAPGVIVAIPIAGFVSVSIRHWREYREIERLVGHAAATAND
jgi:predicted PurR-regulated permease PerM